MVSEKKDLNGNAHEVYPFMARTSWTLDHFSQVEGLVLGIPAVLRIKNRPNMEHLHSRLLRKR